MNLPGVDDRDIEALPIDGQSSELVRLRELSLGGAFATCNVKPLEAGAFSVAH